MNRLEHLKGTSVFKQDSIALQEELDQKIEDQRYTKQSVLKRINQEISNKTLETSVSFHETKVIKKQFNALFSSTPKEDFRDYASKPGRPKLKVGDHAVAKNIMIPANIYKEVTLRQNKEQKSRSKVVGEILGDGIKLDQLRIKQAKLLLKYAQDVKKLIKKLDIKNRDQYWEGVELKLHGNEKVLTEIFILSKDLNRFLDLSFCSLSDFKNYLGDRDLSILEFIKNSNNIASIVTSVEKDCIEPRSSLS
jgi:hypothetical protein